MFFGIATNNVCEGSQVDRLILPRHVGYIEVGKHFKHVRPALEHLVAIEVLERERKPGRKAKWLYRKTDKLGEKVMSIEGE
jgi:hypothetical protein